MVAVMYGHPHDRTAPFTESDWTVLDAPGLTAYSKSKTLAEKAGREFAASDRSGLHYSTVNPGLVLGPALDRDIGTSAGFIRLFLKGKYPGAPRLKIPVVDVRDVAKMHRLAVERDVPTGGRYLGSADCLWLVEIARAIRNGLGPAARKVPDRELPDWLVKIVAIFDGAARQTAPDLGKDFQVDNSRTRRALGMEFIPAPDSAVALARSLIDLKLV
jgi:dihydroflavonol-4-reductase